MLKKIKILKTDDSMDDKIRKIILVEYYARFKKNSKTPEMHMYNFPGLKEMDNEIIFKSAKYLIDANLVRGGIDEEKDHSFPWITRLTPTGIKLIEEE
tara:strand:+ start:197 stop:490 length:294 start_codon:yes stop_codon:yes gene_type:complete